MVRCITSDLKSVKMMHLTDRSPTTS